MMCPFCNALLVLRDARQFLQQSPNCSPGNMSNRTEAALTLSLALHMQVRDFEQEHGVRLPSTLGIRGRSEWYFLSRLASVTGARFLHTAAHSPAAEIDFGSSDDAETAARLFSMLFSSRQYELTPEELKALLEMSHFVLAEPFIECLPACLEEGTEADDLMSVQQVRAFAVTSVSPGGQRASQRTR